MIDDPETTLMFNLFPVTLATVVALTPLLSTEIAAFVVTSVEVEAGLAAFPL